MGEGKRAIIIGAGPAGLTAGLELLRRTGIKPVILEASEEIGGLSRTVKYKGNRMDIGGHRFFSKSDRVMQWWADLMPLESSAESTEQGEKRGIAASAGLKPPLREMGPLADGERNVGDEAGVETVVTAPPCARDPDLVMLIRPRKSRIYFLRTFFDYPIRVSAAMLGKLGLARAMRVGAELRGVADAADYAGEESRRFF